MRGFWHGGPCPVSLAGIIISSVDRKLTPPGPILDFSFFILNLKKKKNLFILLHSVILDDWVWVENRKFPVWKRSNVARRPVLPLSKDRLSFTAAHRSPGLVLHFHCSYIEQSLIKCQDCRESQSTFTLILTHTEILIIYRSVLPSNVRPLFLFKSRLFLLV